MTLRDSISLLRPYHWVKNVFALAALVFSGQWTQPESAALAGLAFAAFCLLSSATYVINDMVDVREDRAHPRKRHRPLAAGRMLGWQAALLGAGCLSGGLVLCALVGSQLLAVGVAFMVLQLLYSFWLKGHVLLDVMCIAFGFVLRAFAGGMAIGVPVSLWLLAGTFALCMFLGFGKRRCEMAELGGELHTGKHRQTLSSYTVPLLDRLLNISAGVAIVTYILYTVDPATVAKIGTPALFFSSPLVVYCVFRFAMLVEGGHINEPMEALSDVPFLTVLALWVIYCAGAVTWGPALEQYVGTSGLLER